jgi:hypothetical protein
LTRVYFKGNAPSVGVNVFDNTEIATVYHLASATGWGTTFAGLPTALWNPNPSPVKPIAPSLSPTGFGFLISGRQGQVVHVEVATNLHSPNWSVLSTNTLSGPETLYQDPQWTNYNIRFYRVRGQ